MLASPRCNAITLRAMRSAQRILLKLVMRQRLMADSPDRATKLWLATDPVYYQLMTESRQMSLDCLHSHIFKSVLSPSQVLQ